MTKSLPLVPEWVQASDIEVGKRTYNCLDAAGLLKNPQDISKRSIGEIIKLPAFGVRSLVDLVCALESLVVWLPLECEPNLEITQRARKLRRFAVLDGIATNDPRFGRLLRSLGVLGANADVVMATLASRAVDPMEPALVIRRLCVLQKQIEKANCMTLSSELHDLTQAAKTERDREITIKYLGWDGNLPRTLESVGEDYKMTRERVRQVAETVLEPIRGTHPFVPSLDRTLRWIRRNVPATAADLESKFHRLNHVRSPFRLESIIAAAVEVGRVAPFEIVFLAGIRVAVAQEWHLAAELLLQIARKSVSKWGVATAEDIAEQLKAASSVVQDRQAVTKLLSSLPDVVWLDEPGGWFWLRALPRNSLLTQIKKIFAVTQRVTLADLRAGVSRHHRRKGFAPPQRVLAALCGQLGWCYLSDGWVVADPQPNAEEVLSGTELRMKAILDENGGIIDREKFEAECRLTGMNETTFDIYLGYSPIIERYARGVYGLRGNSVTPGQVESLKPRSRRTSRVLIDYGWTGEQQILLLYKLSDGLLSNGVAGVPSALQSALVGRYALSASDGAAIGTLVIRENSAWGLLPFFRRRGGEVGDYLSILVDRRKHTATVSVGDETLGEELAGEALLTPEEDNVLEPGSPTLCR